jgi:hypothetical protein
VFTGLLWRRCRRGNALWSGFGFVGGGIRGFRFALTRWLVANESVKQSDKEARPREWGRTLATSAQIDVADKAVDNTSRTGLILIEATIVQRPVGQGGLCEGSLETATNAVRWIYDCGSNQTQRLRKEIRKVHPVLDFVFLSHLDEDHVNGLDHLLLNKDVVEVVLPYLEDHARLFVIAEAIARGSLSGQLLTFISDPVTWLQNRGVERVTFVEGPEDPDGEEGPEPRSPPEVGPERGSIRGKLTPGWITPGGADLSRDGGVARAPSGAEIQMTDEANQVADWILLPFAHPPSKRRVQAFQAELATQFPGLTAAQIVKQAWSDTGREKLRICYAAIWSSDSNLVSMSLYTGPRDPSGRWRTTVSSGHSHHYLLQHGRAPGWLATGDAKLSAPGRCRSFSRFYGGILDQVAVLIVPHHGAANSWDADVLKGMSQLVVGCAAAGPNGYGHPHDEVRNDICATGATFWQVSDDRLSALRLTATI